MRIQHTQELYLILKFSIFKIIQNMDMQNSGAIIKNKGQKSICFLLRKIEGNN